MPTLSFADFTSRVLALYLPPMRSRATYQGMRRALLDFEAAVQPQTLEDFDTGHVAAFVASRAGMNDNTTRSKLRYLRTAANHAIAEGWLDRGPRWGRLFPRRVPGRRRDLDFDQVSLLLRYLERSARRSWVDHRLYALVALVAYTGLRRSEALHLKPIDVRLSEGFLVVSGRRRLKTEASAAPVPIPPGLVPILAGWLPRCGAEWVFPGRMGRGPWVHAAAGYRPLDQLQKAGAACGVPGATFHGLRHTLAKLMVGRWGLSADQARSVLRHTSLDTTEAYYLHRDDRVILASIGSVVRFESDAGQGQG